MKDSTVAIVPIRSISAGKTRLADVLSNDERAHLTRAMLAKVIEAITSADEVARVMVISPDEDTLEHAASLHERIVPILQPEKYPGLDGAIEQGVGEAVSAGAANIMIVFGDLPTVTGNDIRNVLRRDAPVVIGPDRQLAGTNVLMLRRGLELEALRAFHFQYGPGSYMRHLQEAHDLGLDVVTVNMPGIALDLDTPEDLAMLAPEIEALLAGSGQSAATESLCR